VHECLSVHIHKWGSSEMFFSLSVGCSSLSVPLEVSSTTMSRKLTNCHYGRDFTHECTHVHTHAHIQSCTHADACAYACTHTCMHARMYTCKQENDLWCNSMPKTQHNTSDSAGTTNS